MVASPVLRITNGSEYVDIVQSAPYDINKSGIALTKWSPSLPSVNNDGIWTQPIFFGGKSLIYKSLGNTVDTFELIVYGTSQNNVIEKIRKLQDILEKAVYFWTESHTYSPVWLEAKSPYEDKTRYSVIVDYRINEYPNPYLPPFSSRERAAARNITLVIEHKGWTANAPGDSDCVNTYGNLPYPYYLEFYEDTSRVSCAASSAIDDLPSGSFTAEAWVYPEGYGGMGYGAILWKYATNLGWYLRLFNNSYRLEARIECSTTDAYTRTSTSLTQNQWNHVAITYANTTTRLIRVWINGQEAAYSNQVAAVGTYKSDVTENLYIGNDNSNTRNWYGKIGWVRINGAIIYSSSFTPEERCSIPQIAWSGRLLLLHDGHSYTTTKNIVSSSSDGTITDCYYKSDCNGYGRTDAFCSSILNEGRDVFIQNTYINRHLEYVFYYDQSTGSYTTNLVGTQLPYDLLPTPVSAGDALYVGTRDFSVFDNVVFDLVTPGSGFSGTWQYWNGSSWVSFPTDFGDDTDGLTKSGVNSVAKTFVDSSRITQITTVNGVTAYYWRFLVSSATTPTTPVQGNRQVYSCMWPFFRVDNTSSKAQKALGCIELMPVGHSSSRFIIGKRKENRGNRFQGFINFYGYNDPDIFTQVIDISTTIVNDDWCPTYTVFQLFTTAGTHYYIAIRIRDNIASHYIGKFRVFMRYNRAIASSFTLPVTARLIADIGRPDGAISPYPRKIDWISQEVELPYESLYSMSIVDFGEITIQAPYALDSERAYGGITFYLELTTETNGIRINLADLILIPSDEWYSDVFYKKESGTGSDYTHFNEFVTIDSIYNPKRQIRSEVYDIENTNIKGGLAVSASSPLYISNDSIERYFVLTMFYRSSLEEWKSQSGVNLYRIAMHKNDTYMSFAGKS